MSAFSYDFIKDTCSQHILKNRKWSWTLTDNNTGILLCWVTPDGNEFQVEVDRDNFLSGIDAIAENYKCQENTKAIKEELMILAKSLQVRERCLDCAYLVEGEHGEWVCDDCEKNIWDIPDDECSANQEW